MPARKFINRAVLTGLAAASVVVAGLPAEANAVTAVFGFASSSPASGAIVKTASGVTVCFTAPVSPVVASDITVTTGGTPVAGTNAAVTCAAGAGTGVTFTPTTPFAAGDYAVSYSANDTTLPPTGPNTSSGSFSFRLDTAAPAAPVLSTFTSPVDSANVTAVSVTGTAEASHAAAGGINADPITVKLTVHSPAGGANVVRTTTTNSSGNYSFSNVDLSALTDTTGLTYAVQATDSAGNPSTTTTSGSVVKDTTAPALASSTPASGGTHQSTKTIVLTFSEALDPVASSVSVKNGFNTVLAAGTPVFSAGNTTMTLTTTSTMAPAGNPYTVSYTAQDPLTNVASGSFSFTIDDTAPAQPSGVTLTNPINSLNSTAVTVSGSAETGSMDAIDISDGTNHVLTSANSVAGAFSASGIDVSSLADGPISATVVATDAAGNHSTPGTANATKDVVAPAQPTAASVQPDPVNGGSKQTVTVSATVASDVHDATLTLDDGDAGTAPLVVTGVTPDGSHVVSHVFNATSLTDGTLTGTIKAFDAAGNASPVATATAGKDVAAPAQPTVGIAPDPVAAGVSSVTVSGTAEKASTVHLTLDDSDGATSALTHDVIADPTTGDYAWDFALATLHDGTLTATAVAEDAAGNSSPPNSATAPMDRVAPATPVIDSAPAYANIANAAAYHVTGHAEPGSTVDVVLYDDHSPAHTLHKQTTAAGDGAWSVTGNLTSPAVFDDGALHLSVTATDAVGNVSTTPATADRQKDTVAPSAPRVDSYVHPVNNANKTAFAVSGTNGATEPGADIHVSIDDTDAGTAPVTASSTASGLGAYSLGGIDVSSLKDGSLTVTVTSADVAGNPSATGTQVSAAKDTVDLAPVSHTPSAPTTKTPSAVTATYNEPLDPATTTVVVTDKTDTAGAGTVTYNPAGTTVSFTPASPFTEQASPYTVTVTAHDAAGDSPSPLVWSFVVDNTPPGAPVVTSLTNPVNAANAGTVSVGGTAEPLSSVAVDLTDGTHHATGTVPADGNGAWIASLSSADLNDGTLTATAVATDAAGNSSPASTGVTTTKDTVVPAKPVVTTFTNPVNASNVTAVVLGGSAEPGSTVSLDISDGTHHVTPSTTAAGDGTWSVSSVDVSTLTDTTLSAVATATDAAGNVSAFSTAATSVKDTVAPAKPVISALTNPITAANVTAVALTGTAEPDSALSIDLSDGTNHVTKQTTADGSGDWSISNADVSSLSDGTVTAVATATDAAGNASPGSDGVTAPKHTVVPSAPQQLAAAPQDGALHITWTAPATDGGSSVTGYTLTVTPHGSDTPVSTTSPAAAAVASTISGLTNGTAYDVAMTATNAAGTGPAATASGTPRTVPDAPTGVLVTPGDGDLSVSWTAPLSDGGNAIDSYTVTANPGNHTVSTADGDTTNADLTGLTNGTLYTLTVAGHNAAGDGTSSASATGTPRTVAGAPTDVLVTPGDGDLSVSWVAPSVTGGADIDKYTVTANPGGITVSTADGETTNADLTGLANGTRYTLTVVAHNAAGDGPASAPVSGTPRTVPDAPTGVQVTPGDGQLTVSWSAPAQDGGAAIASYTVTANPGSHTATTVDGTTLHAVVSGLTNGTVYSVTVTAHNAAGDGAAATAVNGTPRTVPGAPTGVHVSPGDGAATVTWSAPAQDGGNTITSYTVTATPGSHQFTTADGATHSAHLSGLTNGTQYTFTVTAHNAAGDSGPSAAGVVTPRYLTTLTISTSKTSVSYGTPITLSGQLLDTAHQPVAGASVLIYRVPDAGSTIHLSTVTTNSFGHWTLTYAPGINGVYFARYLGGTADAPAVSRKVGARVAAAVRITSPANNARSSVTSPLVVTGSVTPNKSGATVTLYYVDSKGVAHKLATTPLSPKSAYAFSVKLGKGTWHLLTVIGATTNNIGGRSAILTVSRV